MNNKEMFENKEIFDKTVNELNKKQHFDFQDLMTITNVLRCPYGCPWDREQTNKSVRNAIIDEAYEFIEGLDGNDNKLMCEELGDVLLQIAFHSCIKEETGEFGIDDVIDGVCKKMILRHPHVFGDINIDNSADVLVKWEQIKNNEKQRKTPYEQMQSVAVSLPALMRAQKLQSKSEKTGLADKKSIDEYVYKAQKVLDKIKETPTKESISQLLFCAVGVARTAGFEAEELLYAENTAFLEKFKN